MKFLLFILLFCLFSLQGNSQSNFNLNDIKFRYQNYKGLNLGFSLSENTNNRRNTGSGNERNKNAFGFNGAIGYFSFINTNKKQSITNLYLNSNQYVGNSTGLKVSSFSNVIKFKTVYRNYRMENKFYGVEVSFDNNNLLQKDKNRRNSNSMNSSFLLSAGKGRAEYITDGITAIRLFDELKTKGLLLKEVTNENIIEFSKIIIQYNNTRVLDNRLNMIAMIESMINYLKENQLITEASASTFAILNDQVYFALPITRYCGTVKQFGAGASFENDLGRFKTDTIKSGFMSYKFSQKLVYSILKYKPLNVKNQLNTGMDLSLAYSFNTSSNFID